MKRRNAVTIFALCCATCAAVCGATVCPVRAQTDPAPVKAADDAQIEAAKKEVSEYYAKYNTLFKEKGAAATLRLLLTPDYKQIDALGTVINHDEYIGMFWDASPKESAAWQNHYKNPSSEPATGKAWMYRVNNSDTKDDYAPTADNITVTRHSTVVYTVTEVPDDALKTKPELASKPDPANSREERDVKIMRLIFRRTPDGLRLQEEKTISSKRFINGKLESQQPVPHIGF